MRTSCKRRPLASCKSSTHKPAPTSRQARSSAPYFSCPWESFSDMARRYSTIFVLAITLAGCASTHVVRPLGQGNGMVNASLGGPFLNVFDANIPTPIVSLGGGYGVRDWLDVYGHVDVTALAFGVLHVDPGVAFHPVIRE